MFAQLLRDYLTLRYNIKPTVAANLALMTRSGARKYSNVHIPSDSENLYYCFVFVITSFISHKSYTNSLIFKKTY